VAAVRSYVHPVIPLAVFLIFVTCSEMLIRRYVFHTRVQFFLFVRQLAYRQALQQLLGTRPDAATDCALVELKELRPWFRCGRRGRVGELCDGSGEISRRRRRQPVVV